MLAEFKQLCAEVRDYISNSNTVSRDRGPDEPFERLALRLFQFQFTHNRRYQGYCRHLERTPETVSTYREIPAIVTSAFKELELTVLPEGDRPRAFYSSGTTQEKRSRHFHNADTLQVYDQSVLKWFRPFVLPDRNDAGFLCLIPSVDEAVNSSLAHMMRTVTLEFGQEVYLGEQIGTPPSVAFVDQEGVWQAHYEQVVSLADLAAESNLPLVICGTAFAFVHLCDYLASRKQFLKFPTGSRVFETGGYKGRSREVPKQELHEMITRWLGIEEKFIISEYGMSELSSQAYDRVAGQEETRAFRFPPWVRWHLISPETGRPAEQGEAGLVRIWDLANVGSVVAIQTEDLARRVEDGFVLCGRAAAAEARGCSLMMG